MVVKSFLVRCQVDSWQINHESLEVEDRLLLSQASRVPEGKPACRTKANRWWQITLGPGFPSEI
jgi:hypothetical protein